jgi:hypothetical protein
MNFRKTSILDRLMRGSEVPQPDWYYFLEMERITPKRYERKWVYLDNVCQTDFSHIPETFTVGDETIIMRVRKTRNPKMPKLLYDIIGRTMAMGLLVELDTQ